MRDLAFAAVWLALIPMMFVSGHIGVLAWVWSALLSPNEMLYGPLAGVPFNKIAAILASGMILAQKYKRDPYVDATLLVLVALGAVATVSWALSVVQMSSMDDLYFKLLKELVLVAAISAAFTTRQRLESLLIVTAAALGFLAVKEGLLSIATLGGHRILGSGAIGDNNSLAAALLMILPVLIFLARHSAVKLVSIGFYAVSGLAVVTVVMTFSRGGFLGLLTLAAFLVKNSRQKVASIAAVALVGALIVLFAPESWFARLNTIETANQDTSFMTRVIAWKISWLIALDHPMFGGGPHAAQLSSVWEAYRLQADQMDIVPTPPSDSFPHAAHSIYFEVLGDLGFGGLAVFLVLIAVALYNCRWIRRASRHCASPAWTADLARMLQISIVVYLVTGVALSMAYFELLYVLVAILSRCRRNMQLEMAAGRTQGLVTARAMPEVQLRRQLGRVAGPIATAPPVSAPAWRRSPERLRSDST